MKNTKYFIFFIICIFTMISIKKAENQYYEYKTTTEEMIVDDVIKTKKGYLVLSNVNEEIYYFDENGIKKDTKTIDTNDYSYRAITINDKNYLISYVTDKEVNNEEKYFMKYIALDDTGTITEQKEIELNDYFNLPVYLTSFQDIIKIEMDTYTYVYGRGTSFLKIMNDLSKFEVVHFNDLPESDKKYADSIEYANSLGQIKESYKGGYIVYKYGEKTIKYTKNQETIWTIPNIDNCADIFKYKDYVMLYTQPNLITPSEGEPYYEQKLHIINDKGEIINNNDIFSLYTSLGLKTPPIFNEYFGFGFDNSFFIVTEWQHDNKNVIPSEAALLMFFNDGSIIEEPKIEEEPKKEIIPNETDSPNTIDSIHIVTIISALSAIFIFLSSYKKSQL